VSLQSVDDASTGDSTTIELEKHTRIIGQLLEIAAETDLNFDERKHFYTCLWLLSMFNESVGETVSVTQSE